MGYSTDFEGGIEIEPALNADEIAYLLKFSESRRMDRENGPYFVDGDGMCGQGDGPDEVYEHNHPHSSQPSLWCQWVPTDDGTALEWNGFEKFYEGAAWMQYIMDHFIGFTPAAKDELPFLQGHVCNGTISAQGEDPDDSWLLEVRDNQAFVQDLIRTAVGMPVPVATSINKLLAAPAPEGKSVVPDSGGK